MMDFKAKMHQIRFRLGLRRPDPAGGAYSAPQTPLLDLGPLRGRGRGWAGEEEGKREGNGGSGGEGKGRPPSYC